MSFTKGARAPRRKPPAATQSCMKQRTSAAAGSERKMRSLQSLQQRLCFTLKRPRSSRARGHGGSSSRRRVSYGDLRAPSLEAKSTIMESGLIQIPLWHCDYYESPSPLSIPSPTALASSSPSSSTITTTTASSASSDVITTSATINSSITQVGGVHSPISSYDISSDDGFSSDEVMSLVSCSDMAMQNALDFMPSTLERLTDTCCEEAKPSRCPKAARPETTVEPCEQQKATLEQASYVCHSNVEDDGEPYRIDLCDFEPDVNAFTSPSRDAPPRRNDGGGVLCLRLDYEEVIRAWKERGGCVISREPTYNPSPLMDPLHIFGYYSAPFVPPYPPFF